MSSHEYARPTAEEPRPSIRSRVSRSHGPSADEPRYTWNPAFSSSDPVRHSKSTDASPPVAVNDCSRTAVVPKYSSAPMSQDGPVARSCASMSVRNGE